MLLERHLICLTLFCAWFRAVFAHVQVTVCKQVFPFEQQFPGLFLLWLWPLFWDLGGPEAPKIHPLCDLLCISSEVLVGVDPLAGTWLAGTTCPTTAFAGISMVWVLKLLQADRYPWGPWMELPIGCGQYHCCWQLGTWCQFHEYMYPHAAFCDTGIGMHTYCAEQWYSDSSVVCGLNLLHHQGGTVCTFTWITLRGGMTYLLFHPCFAWVCMGQLQQSRHDCPKVSLPPCHGCLLMLPLCYQAKGPSLWFQSQPWLGPSVE